MAKKSVFLKKFMFFFQIWPFLPPNISGFLDFFEKKAKNRSKISQKPNKNEVLPPKLVKNGPKW